jgi:hypothetical protein
MRVVAACLTFADVHPRRRCGDLVGIADGVDEPSGEAERDHASGGRSDAHLCSG